MKLYYGGFGDYMEFVVAENEEQAILKVGIKINAPFLPITVTEISEVDGYAINAGNESTVITVPNSDIGEFSDGYHTFNELYHHRAVLFSVICNDHKDLAWKSLQHNDPCEQMYDGMFIVGINTPSGQATYHYDVEPYWDMFDVPTLERAPKWDGHTPSEAIARISSLCEKPIATFAENVIEAEEVEITAKETEIKSEISLRHCKKCEFTCETQGQLLAHYREFHSKGD